MRRAPAIVCLVVGAVLAAFTAFAIYVHRDLLQTGNYVSLVGPLASNPSVQQAVAHRVEAAIVDNVDTSGIDRSQLHDAIQTVVTSDAFAQVWVTVNREAHAQLVSLVTGNGDVVKLRGDAVVLDLEPIAVRVQDALDSQGITQLDGLSAQLSGVQLTLIRSHKISQVRGAVSLLDTLAWWLIPISGLILGAGIFLWPRRRRGLLWAALGVSIAGAIVLIALVLVRGWYLTKLPRTLLPKNAASAIFDTIVDPFWLLLLIGTGVAAAIWVVLLALELRGRRTPRDELVAAPVPPA